MLTGLVITVGLASANIVGHTNREIQAAVDRVAAHGGGEVRLLAGTYDMEDSLHLRSGVHIVGQGEQTVLRKLPSVSSPIPAYLGYGHFDITVAEPDKFHVGMGVHIHDKDSGGFYDTVGTLTWRDGDRFGINRFLNHDYGPGAEAAATSIFPVISGYNLKGASVENLGIEGNKGENAYLNGCRGGGVFLYQAHDVALRKLFVRNYNGDGISFQQCRGTVVEGCLVEDNTGLGLHPGSGSVGPIMRKNISRHNGGDGVFYCLRVSYSLCEGNTIEDNGGYGISIGGRDTDNLIRGNTIRRNGKAGIYFREGDLVMAGSRQTIERNVLEGDCRQEGTAEIDIQGETRDVHLLDNTLRPERRGDQAVSGLLVCPKADRIVFAGNKVEGDGVRAVDNQAAPTAVSTERPAKPLRVGPKHIPKGAAAHLG
jgi:parallel beta-helix repeat protein